MKKLTEAVKQMLDGLAYAHAGELLSTKEKTLIFEQKTGTVDYPVPEVLEAAKARTNNNLRRVALYLGSELPPEVMDYVIQTCSRLGHELTVLTFESERNGKALLRPHQQALEAAGVGMELVTLYGEPISGLGRYLRNHPEVAFLACKDSGYLGRSYLKDTQRKNAIPVPVVVIATNAEGTGTQGQRFTPDGNSEAVVA
jgi:hypothetical protein